jgi:subtilisin family serine protease
MTAQIAPNKYFVKFTDKNNSPYSIDNPSEYLSQRAIDRRQNQGIPITVSDLPVNPSYLEGVAGTGATILNRTKWFNGVTIFTEDPSVLDAITALPYVAGVTAPEQPGGDLESSMPFDEKPFFAHEKYNVTVSSPSPKEGSVLSYDYGQSMNQIAMLRGDELHNLGFRGQGMVIAVLDAGFINANILDVFDSLWINGQILGTHDFVRGGEVSFDEHPHGSMVLSCMGGNYPGELIGTAPKASYWLLRTEDGGSEYIIEEYNWVSGAEFADSAGVDVINSSLGYTVFNDPNQDHTYSDMDGDTAPATIGADIAASKGILVVNSLGNEGSSSWYYLSVPSDGDSVCGVGAVDDEGNYASFSSHGPSYDGRVKPNVAAQGSGCWVVEPYSGSFTFGSGTSFSSPILAGMAACLWQSSPEQTNMEVLEAMQQSASQYSNPDDLLGYGIPDFMEAKNILTIIDSYKYETEHLTVFPNPFHDHLVVDLKDVHGRAGEMCISDLQGRVLYTSDLNDLDGSQLSIYGLGTLSEGMYIVKVSMEERVLVSKAVKD